MQVQVVRRLPAHAKGLTMPDETVKRYEPTMDYDGDGHYDIGERQDKDGRFVLYPDHAAEVERVRRETVEACAQAADDQAAQDAEAAKSMAGIRCGGDAGAHIRQWATTGRRIAAAIRALAG